MSGRWDFDQDTGLLTKDGYPIATLTAAPPGHCMDTGSLIAVLLSWHEEACADTGTAFFGALATSRKV